MFTYYQSVNRQKTSCACHQDHKQTQVRHAYGGVVAKYDVSVPIARMPEFLNETIAMLEHYMPGIIPHSFGHLGDGNIHCNFIQPRGMDGNEFRKHMPKMEEMVHDLLMNKYHGSFSAEHGIGHFKRDELARRKSPVEMAIMRQIKTLLDPQNIMNPGSVV